MPVSNPAPRPSPAVDFTHDAAARSWVASADGHAEFPLQNLPMGVLAVDGVPRLACAIGDDFLDLAQALDAACLPGLDHATAQALRQGELNAWMALVPAQKTQLRHAIFRLLQAPAPAPVTGAVVPVFPRAMAQALVPARVGDYTDFYAGIHHATNAGKFFRPEMPLLPNYKHVPIGYHGRSSSIEPSGTELRRPNGQSSPGPGQPPVFGPTRKLDFELEVAVWLGGGNPRGTPVAPAGADDLIAGYGLLNDWSSRDIQAWEYQPLGPFLGKNFMTTVSPWVITADALAPFRCPQMARGENDPQPLPYLQGETLGGIDIELRVTLSTQAMREQGLPAFELCRTNASELWWTPAQLVAHHTSGGCNLRAGDLFGTGTISSPGTGGMGSLLELSDGGRQPLALPSGETRLFLEAGDEVVFEGHCGKPGFQGIGFGPCAGRLAA